MNGTCGGSVDVSNAFRVGTDGLVAPLPAAAPFLPQPTFPGVNDVSAAAGEALDVHFRPNVVDSFDLTIQRQLTNKVLLEVGYIGRRITHEYQPININAVPHMIFVSDSPAEILGRLRGHREGAGLRNFPECLRRKYSIYIGRCYYVRQHLRGPAFL